ncbi:glycoside hydrolase family 9 protein [Vibrio sp. WXL210]|uniref:glycoside hydrolase family 9 protein n=1 Tax=Vibrio sp. WXL210 TaxID=3450709 RepID=UPI003EC79442
MQLLVNHIGYDETAPKHAVLMAKQPSLASNQVTLHCARTHQVQHQLTVGLGERCDNWHQGYFYTVDFSAFRQPGRYYLQHGDCRSHPFCIEQKPLYRRTFSDLLHYFKSQRCSGEFERNDHQVPLRKSEEFYDVRGGWYDASGDVSKYLSHLSYANYLNPQQTPMVVWNMLKSLTLLEQRDELTPMLRSRLCDEALHGCDFLMRMQHPDGFFFTTVFDRWSKQTEQREICSYAGQAGEKSADYQAAFRQGGGVTIAALALAARLRLSGEFSHDDYLVAAERGYRHLTHHNRDYLNDGTENIIDEYCALLASVALYQASGKDYYLGEAQQWAQQLMLRQQSDMRFRHFWSANHDGSRPYYHASEAGMPVIALCEYLSLDSESTLAQKVRRTITQACQFELDISTMVTNPFGYPRQYIKATDQPKQDAFFIPHNNESEYWWQGENARLASLAAMAWMAGPHLTNQRFSLELKTYAQRCLDWIVGLNPFDICMLDGHGYNNPDYLPSQGFFNAKGGICNGITAGFSDETDIAFNPRPQCEDALQNWRWGEQWIPHAAWYLLAISCQASEAKGVSQSP